MNNRLDLTSLILQILSLDLISKDYNNSDLMNELQHQNKEYLEKIIQQNNEIIDLLKKGGNINGRQSNQKS